MMKVDNSIPAHANEEFAKAFFTLLAHANNVDNIPKMEKWMWLEDFERNDITPVEAYYAFWGARGDEYVGKSGIQFKHIMKHVRKFRNETYEVPEMGPTMEEYLEGKVSDSAD